ncbi:MAG: precorrin-8X methylmutase, partial [Fusobacterium periodonticum]|nr:precorrin-8X methylmutase [Fusobacterium periodonticum]
MSYIKVPGDIEKRSFEIIEEELGDKAKKFSESEMPIVKRIIHTSADFEYADLIEFQNNAIESGLKALEKG